MSAIGPRTSKSVIQPNIFRSNCPPQKFEEGGSARKSNESKDGVMPRLDQDSTVIGDS